MMLLFLLYSIYYLGETWGEKNIVTSFVTRIIQEDVHTYIVNKTLMCKTTQVQNYVSTLGLHNMSKLCGDTLQ